jgi:hypothetical protein
MDPIHIDVFFPVPEGWGMCTSCEVMMSQASLGQAPQERGLEEYPPEWQEEFKHLSSIVISLSEQYPNEVQIRIWDPRSLQGMWKSIRHGIRQYPTYIVNGRIKFSGWDTAELEQHLQSILGIGNSAI